MPSFKSIAYEILRKAKKPLHSKEITEIALKKGLIKTSGKTPEATMNSQLIRDVHAKKEKSRFIKVGPSVFSLNENAKPTKSYSEKPKSKSTKGALIKGMSKRFPVSIIQNQLFKEWLKDVMHHKAGIYALYDGKELYYVGLTENLLGRIRAHLKDKHAGKWDSFTTFKITKVRYLKDIETLIHHIVDAPGNRVKGKVPQKANINRLLHDVLKEQEQQFKDIKKSFKKSQK